MKLKSYKPSFAAMFSWCFFDWANSAFASIITTFIFATYFTGAIAKNKIIGTQQWGDAIALAGITIALISPILGAIADNEGRRKPWLAAFSLLAIFASFMLWFSLPGEEYIRQTLIWVILGTIGIEVGMVFYNAMLSDLASEKYLGRLSGWAWGLGYVGGLVALSITLFLFVFHSEIFGLNKGTYEHVRITGPLVGIWFAVFGWPLFVFTPDQPSSGLGIVKSMQKGLYELYDTFLHIKQYRNIVLFFVARMLYTDALNTIFAFGGIYAAGTFNLSYTEVIIYGIAMNLSAGIGAMTFASLDDKRGSKFTILLALLIMTSTGIGILIVQSKLWFWILSLGVALNVGPIQAASRSLMIRLAPKAYITEMFGLYALSGKITAFVGPWVLGMATVWAQSQRAGMATVMIFLLVGGAILLFVKETKTVLI